ncbi:MAG: methyltransferase [Pseudomonadota bacterium]
MPLLPDWLARLRDRLVLDPRFVQAVQSLPLVRLIARRESEAVFDIVAGFVSAQTLSALLSLGILRDLAAGPQTTAALSEQTGLPADRVEGLLWAGHAVGLVEPRRAGWGLTMQGASVCGQRGVAEMVAHHTHLYGDLADPVALLKGSEPTALSRYWTYTPGAEAGDAAPYTALMAASQAFIADAVLHNREFARARHLVDLGGGAAAFAIAACKRHPNLTVTVADRAEVIPLAEEAIAAAGLTERIDTKPVDFFSDSLAFPGADIVTLVRILHDHDDDAVRRLLSGVATGTPDSQLLIVEPMANRRHPTRLDAYFFWYFRAMRQGRLRTAAEIDALLASAGYAPSNALATRNKTLVRVRKTHVSSR